MLAGITVALIATGCLKNEHYGSVPCKSTTYAGHTRVVPSYPHDCPAPAGITLALSNTGLNGAPHGVVGKGQVGVCGGVMHMLP